MSISYIKGSLARGPYGQAPFSQRYPPPPKTLGVSRLGPVADQKGLRSWLIEHKTVQGCLCGDALVTIFYRFLSFCLSLGPPPSPPGTSVRCARTQFVSVFCTDF